MNRQRLPQFVVTLVLVGTFILSITGCSAVQGFFATPTPTNTPTPTSTNTPTPTNTPTLTPTSTPTPTSTNTPTLTPTNTPTATPKPLFIIKDSIFKADADKRCEQLDIAVTAINGDTVSITFREGSLIPFNVPIMRCYGGKYTWMGKLTYQGYVFASDNSDPLQFESRTEGYIYLKGQGTVTLSDKTVVTLPGAYSGAGVATPTPSVTARATSTPTSPQPSATARATSTPTSPQPSATAAPRGGLLFEDNFSSEQVSKDKGWLFGSNGAGTLYRTWSPNTYTMKGQGQGFGCNMYWMDSTLDIFSDFGVEIIAQSISKSAEYGIAFRADGNPRNALNWYAFSVNTAGEYRFRKRVNGDYLGKDLILSTASKDLKPGQERNRLGVLAEGSTFSFYVNGNLVNTIKDSSFTQGRVGFYLCPFQDSSVEVAFSRMTILTVERAKIDLANTGK